MEGVSWERKPSLRKPTMISAFTGWNDAAGSATAALEFLGGQFGVERAGTIDPDEFFDFQVTRPTVTLTEGQTRQIDWPEVTISTGRAEGADRDVVLLSGAEPNLRWRAFCTTILDTARELNVQLIVTLGALLADVPHTRDVQITGIASSPELVARLGFTKTRYEGPTGIVGVLHDACAKSGVAAASLWAPVPHYVAAVPSPKAALALTRAVEGLLDVTLDSSDLEEASAEYERRLDEAVASEPEVRALVERLEQQADEAEISFGDLPSGDSIARDFERFLRQRGKDQN
jgi:proteasome assembly chaperone (PAC2) family protein